MIAYLIRFIKRVGLLVPGLVITYLAIKKLYPPLEHRTPIAVAILATYVLTAYGLIPLALRFIRTFAKSSHLPLYCITPDGFASDPVNIALIGTRNELIDAMTKAGWFQADRRTIKNLFKMALAFAFDKPYRHAPFSKLYLFGRGQDIGFQKPLDNNPLHRHHVRFWAATYQVSPKHREHVSFWFRHHEPTLDKPSRFIWVGAASLDKGIGLIRHNAQLTHMIHPNTNEERELIVKDLSRVGSIKRTRSITVGTPYQIRNRVWRGMLHADGKLTICELK